MSSVRSDVLEIPAEDVNKGNGITFDIGSSVAKILYRSKEDYKDGKPLFTGGEKTGRLRLAWIRRENIDEIIEFIKQNCDITRPPDGTPTAVLGTGVGTHFFFNKLQTELNLKLKTLIEFDCFVKALKYLEKALERDVLFLPPNPTGKKEAEDDIKMFMGMMDGAKIKMETETKFLLDHDELKGLLEKQEAAASEPEAKAEKKPFFPCLLGMLGSGFAFFKVDEDGTFTMLDGLPKGGRTFLGLGNIISGERNFDKLISMAEKGNYKNVDVFSEDMKTKEEDREGLKEDAYSAMPDGMYLFNFGKAADQDRANFKNEDLIASLLNSQCMEIVQLANYIALRHSAPNVYFSGNFVRPEITQRHMTKGATLASLAGTSDMTVNFQFLRYGGHLGAIGAYLLYGSTEKKEEAKEQ